MRNKKTYSRLILIDDYDIPGMETWLADMAEKGYFLDYFNRISAVFRKAAPRQVRYRLELAGADKDFPSLECRQIYEANGWRFIASLHRRYYVFLAEDNSAEEIHTDPLVQSITLDRLNRQLVISTIVGFVMIAALFGFIISTSHNGSFVQRFLLNMSLTNFVWELFFLLLIAHSVVGMVEISRLRKRLRSGIPLNHQKNYRRRAALRIAEYVLWVVLIAAFILGFFIQGTIGEGHFQSLSELKGDIPILSLSDLQGNENGGPGNTPDDRYGYYWRDYSVLIPVQYVITQNGYPSPALPPDDPGFRNGQMTTYYYKPLFPFLTKPLYDALIKQGLGNTHYTELGTQRLDGAAHATLGNMQSLVAWKNDRVIEVWYKGDQDLTGKLDLVARVLEES